MYKTQSLSLILCSLSSIWINGAEEPASGRKLLPRHHGLPQSPLYQSHHPQWSPLRRGLPTVKVFNQVIARREALAATSLQPAPEFSTLKPPLTAETEDAVAGEHLVLVRLVLFLYRQPVERLLPVTTTDGIAIVRGEGQPQHCWRWPRGPCCYRQSRSLRHGCCQPEEPQCWCWWSRCLLHRSCQPERPQHFEPPGDPKFYCRLLGAPMPFEGPLYHHCWWKNLCPVIACPRARNSQWRLRPLQRSLPAEVFTRSLLAEGRGCYVTSLSQKWTRWGPHCLLKHLMSAAAGVQSHTEAMAPLLRQRMPAMGLTLFLPTRRVLHRSCRPDGSCIAPADQMGLRNCFWQPDRFLHHSC